MRRLIPFVVLAALALSPAPASATPVATSDGEYDGLGAVFPDPLANCGGPSCDPNARGNVPATQFIQLQELFDGLKYMNTREDWQRYLEVLVLDGRYEDGSATAEEVEADPTIMFPGNNYPVLEFEPKPEYVSAGIPTTDLSRQKSDLVVARVTDETVPDDEKKRYTLSLSIHGIERAGAEGGTRAMEDLVTAFTTGRADDPIVNEAVKADAPTFADVLRKTIIYFTWPNPDGWRRGSVLQGGPDFQRYNGNGVDPNRDWPDIGYSFRGYSGASEPETRAFKGFYDDLLGDGKRFHAGSDLHGQPEADALSFTLLPHGRHHLGKDARLREAARRINRGQYEATKWSALIRENEELSVDGGNEDCSYATDPTPGPVCEKVYAQTWGTVYDTINYTTTGTLADWFDSSIALRAEGLANEMSFSHIDKHINFEPQTEQLHVAGNKALIYAHVANLLDPITATFDANGRQGYVASKRLKRLQAQGEPGPPPNTVPQDDISDQTGVPDSSGRTVMEFDVQQTEPEGGNPGIYNGGMRIDVTTLNFQGVSSGQARMSVQCLGCDDHVGSQDSQNPEWVIVAEDYNQSPIYAQAGLTVAVNRPDAFFVNDLGKREAVEWRVVVEFCETGPIFDCPVSGGGLPIGPTRMNVDFSGGPATSDGATGGDQPPLLRGYNVANTDVFHDLNRFIEDENERFERVDPKRVIAGEQSLSGLESLVLADEFLPGYTGKYKDEFVPSGNPTPNIEFAQTRQTQPGQTGNAAGETFCQRDEAHSEKFEFQIAETEANRSMTVEIHWDLPAEDYDLIVLRKEADGRETELDQSADFATDHESVTIPEPTPGTYIAHVLNCSAVVSSWAGTVTFEAYPPAEAAPPSDYTPEQKDVWAQKLRAWVQAGGNLVLTDGALRGLNEVTDVPGKEVRRQTVYVGQMTFARCADDKVAADDASECESGDPQPTVEEPLARNVNLPASRFNTGFRRQTFESTPLGFAIQDESGGDESNARQYDINASAFKAAGGKVVAMSANSGERNAVPVYDRVTLGEIPVGSGQVRVAGALLPQPSTEFDHQLGLEPYALTYTGYILICNLLDANCTTRPGEDPTPQPNPDNPDEPGNPPPPGGGTTGGGTTGSGGGGTTTGGGGGGTQEVCASTAGFRSVSASRRGRGLRLAFDRRESRPVDVDVFQVAQGRRVLRERLVARFSDRDGTVSWNGRGRRGRRLRDGYYFVRFRMEKPGADEFRRITLRRSRGRFSARPSFYRTESCGPLRSYKLVRPVFGGRNRTPLGASYQLNERADVTITVRRGSRTIRTFRQGTVDPRRTHRVRLSARGLRRGDYRVTITVRAGNSTLTSTLVSRRL